MQTTAAQQASPDYRMIFAQVDAVGNVDLLRVMREVSAQEEAIKIISQITEEITATQVVTFLSD